MISLVNTPQFRIDSLELGPMQNLIYLITDKATNKSAVVDPAWDVPQIFQLSNNLNTNITDILLTHSHHDHINGVHDILDQKDAQLHLLKAEADFWQDTSTTPSLYYGGDRIELGDTEIKILHTPGHTPGSACYQIGDYLITGDTLFVWGCGRCDLAGGDPEVMFQTLKKLAQLPPQTTTLPGHNYATQVTASMESQCEGNPFMHFHEERAFCQYRMVEHDRVRGEPYGMVKDIS